ncbi:hypothetical protein SAMN04487947_3738 [Halogeometricum rufum]|uniref:Uncharacterized protein n=1 Tax=Halogeometricum rufum TaxID=553469 RepID=A0A1I6IWZ6_9EURY|nr:hypothetical protein [Halogeometricum rufum]SFR70770.1 hypothetical protein SAMN04487947_3738 [Halogeometricum rufum]
MPEGYELGHAGTRVVDVAGGEGTGARDAASADSESETRSETSDATRCPVCDDDYEKLFHAHLTPPRE